MARILLIEDNEMNIDWLVRRLQRKGHVVLVATDGAAGVAMGQAEKPDVILMDLSLPVMDGWEATRRLRMGADTRAIPIIALTAHAMADDQDKALAAGCDDYETKPVDFATLLAKIETLLSTRKS